MKRRNDSLRGLLLLYALIGIAAAFAAGSRHGPTAKRGAIRHGLPTPSASATRRPSATPTSLSRALPTPVPSRRPHPTPVPSPRPRPTPLPTRHPVPTSTVTVRHPVKRPLVYGAGLPVVDGATGVKAQIERIELHKITRSRGNYRTRLFRILGKVRLQALGYSALYSARDFYAVDAHGRTYRSGGIFRGRRPLRNGLLRGGFRLVRWIGFTLPRLVRVVTIIWNDDNHLFPAATLATLRR